MGALHGMTRTQAKVAAFQASMEALSNPPLIVWQDVRGLWYSREWRPWATPVAKRSGPYGTEKEARDAT